LPYGVSFTDKQDVQNGQIVSESLMKRLAMLIRDVRVYGGLLARQRRPRPGRPGLHGEIAWLECRAVSLNGVSTETFSSHFAPGFSPVTGVVVQQAGRFVTGLKPGAKRAGMLHGPVDPHFSLPPARIA
jgi:hypothetical protein